MAGLEESLRSMDKACVLIKPNSSKSRITSYDKEKNCFIIELKAIPRKGQANLELVKFLRRTLKKDVSIKSGFASRQKLIKIS